MILGRSQYSDLLEDKKITQLYQNCGRNHLIMELSHQRN